MKLNPYSPLLLFSPQLRSSPPNNGLKSRSHALYPWSTRKVLRALRRSATGTGIVMTIVRIMGGMGIIDPVTDLTMAIP
jgi:hypothetical protein